MTILHAQTLVEHARHARGEKSTRGTSSSTRDLFCARLVGYLRAYDTRVADELALTLEMPELAAGDMFKLSKEKQA